MFEWAERKQHLIWADLGRLIVEGGRKKEVPKSENKISKGSWARQFMECLKISVFI